ncbi:MAG: amino acid adenylation domain-containing protein [Candidatus Aminicenantes bacterium]|jgi:amino acid adenylation domain-containing protein
MRDEIDENYLFLSAKFLKQKAFWKNKLSGEISQTTFLYSAENIKEPGNKETIEITLPDNIYTKITKLSKGADLASYVILLAALKVLIYRYTSTEDISVLSPVYKLKVTRDTINNGVLIRNRLRGDMTFKELMLDVKSSVEETYTNQDYPLKKVLEDLISLFGSPGSYSPRHGTDTTGPHMDITNVLCSFKNIHVYLPAGTYSLIHIGDIKAVLSFSFERNHNPPGLKGVIEYAPTAYKKNDIEQISAHLVRILEEGTRNLNQPIAHISILSEQEKKQLIMAFNNNKADFSRDKTVHQWVETQAQNSPHGIALQFQDRWLTYSHLNERANHRARLLRKEGIGVDQLVGIMMNRSPLMAESIMAVWKAGGAYIPLDPENPLKKISGILKDSGAVVLLTEEIYIDPQLQKVYSGRIIAPDKLSPGNSPAGANPDWDIDMKSLSYVIYTSGSTGNPKGAMVIHLGMMNHIQAKINDLQMTAKSVVAQNANHTFDISVWQFFTALMLGARTVIYPQELQMESLRFLQQLVKDRVTILELVPSYLSVILDDVGVKEKGKHDNFPLSLEYLLVTGEKIKWYLVKKWFENYPRIKMVNAYGPTEASDDITHHIMVRPPQKSRVPIGKPVQNMDIYIIDPHMQLCPVGVKGELVVAGVGVGRGYLNDPQKTAEKFCLRRPGGRFLKKLPLVAEGKRIYKTGDLACWLPDGSIEFFGRKDYQVKIRGFRIELGEIEACLAKHKNVKDAVVIDKKDETGNKYLCAYIVVHSSQQPSTTRLTGLKEYLAQNLPDYMIPSYFLEIENIPLLPSGKINRNALPSPELLSRSTYAAPEDEIQKKLADIWAEVLGKNMEQTPIGIDDNFFDLGGHSLKATVIAWQIHKELNVKVPLAEIFETPTIRGLAGYIKGTARDRYSALEPVEKKEFYHITPPQRRMYILQQKTPSLTSYNISRIVTIKSQLDKQRLENTFCKLIRRHENLRTSFVRVKEHPVQKVHRDIRLTIDFHQVGQDEVKIVVNRFVGEFDLSKAPLMRVGILKVGEENSILMVDMHHIISDGVSEEILIKEFMTLYEEKELPPLRLHYKDYSEWQNNEKQKLEKKRQEKYWLKEFEGELPVLNLPADFHRPPIKNFEGKVLGFRLDKKETSALKTLAQKEETTLYLTLLAIYFVFLEKLSGQSDISVGTPIIGRKHIDLKNIIGMFVGTLVLRNYPEGEKTFRDFLGEIKKRTLEAFENQDYPLEELKAKVNVQHDPSRNPLFDVSFQFWHLEAGEEQNTEAKHGLTFEPYEYEFTKSIFDLYLQGAEVGEIIMMQMSYCTKLFKEETIRNFIKYYKEIVSSVIENRDLKLKDIKISHGLLDSHSAIPQMDFGF